MPNISYWIGDDRAADAWKRINEKPTSIIIVRNGADLSAQTVRIEANNTTSEIKGEGDAISSSQRVVAFGVRDHATIADTDIDKGDLFKANGLIHRVISVTYQTGEIQAICEVQS